MTTNPDHVAIYGALSRLYMQRVLIREQVVAVCDILGIPESPALDGHFRQGPPLREKLPDA